MSEKQDQQALEREMGPQPLDTWMTDLEIKNTDLVRISPSQLSHKVVGKGRKGKRLTRKAQKKILEAIVLWCREEQVGPEKWNLDALFTYRGN